MIFQLDESLHDDAADFLKNALQQSFSPKRIDIYDSHIEVDLNEKSAEQKVSETIEKLLFVGRSIRYETLFQQAGQPVFSQNPMDALQESGQVKKLMNGAFVYQGKFLTLFKYFNEFWLERALAYDAVEQDAPLFWPVDLYKKINYLSEFPQQVILCSSLKDDFSSREDFAENYSTKTDFTAVKHNDHFRPSEYGMQCAVCDYCYYLLEGARNYPNTVYTVYNKVFRNEMSEIDSLDRLTCFSVRDIMFVGDEAFVMDLRDNMINEAKQFLELLGLESKIMTANDPFFGNDAVLKNLFQTSMSLKYEILAKLPFADKFIAIGSINLHRNFFGETFDIQLPDESHAWSGCIGIGFDRLVYALFCQYGMDFSKWPTNLQTICRD